MRLRKECIHGRWEAHSWIEGGGVPFDELRGVDCPGGGFTEDAELVERINDAIETAIPSFLTWEDRNRLASVIVDALAADQVGEPR